MKFTIFLLFIVFEASFADYKRLRCLVCRTTIEEMTKQIDTVNPKKKIQIGGYKIDDSGKPDKKLIPFARSGMHLSELMDTICEKINNYVRATDKKTGKLVLLSLVTESGSLNPDFGDYDIIQDSDLNQSLLFYCEGIVEEFEEEIYNELKEASSDPVNAICTKATKLCDSTVKDEL